MAKSSAKKTSKAATPAKSNQTKKVEPLTKTPKAIKKTPAKAAGKESAASKSRKTKAKTSPAATTIRKRNTDLKQTKPSTTRKKTTAATPKAGAKATKSKSTSKTKASLAGRPVAARSPEKARTKEQKAAEATEATPKPAAKASTKSEVAKKLIQSKAAKGKAAGAKTKTARPISFTLDEALQIAKTSGEAGAGNNGNGAENAPAAAAREKQAKDVAAEVKQENRVLGAASISEILGYNPNAGPKQEEASEIPAKFSRYYKLLIELREHVLSGLDIHTRDTLKRSAKEDSGDLSAYSQHMADAGTDTFDRDFALSLVSSEQEALFEIEDAIRRIKKGSYGTCEITGKPIKKERLLAVPFAKFSVEGQAEYERTHRKSAYRGGAFGDSSEDPVQFMDDDSDE